MKPGYDVVVVGAGVIGAATAFYLSEYGAERVLLVDRGDVCSGGTARSCAIVRSHYSIVSNTRLTLASLKVFRDFQAALRDSDVDSGFVNSGYVIVAGAGASSSMKENLEKQAGAGAHTFIIDKTQALELHPWINVDDAAVIGYEPESGYADPYLTTTGFIRGARNNGVDVRPNREASEIRVQSGKVTGVRLAGEWVDAATVVSAIGPWTRTLTAPLGLELPLEVSRHMVLTFRGDAPYRKDLPVVKDLITENKMYFRPSTGGVVLVGTGDHGDPAAGADDLDEQVSTEFVLRQGRQVAHRVRGFEQAALVDSWVGPYDITPDWNPVIGSAPGVSGLYLAFGFSGHGFKLAPAVGMCLAQTVLGEEPIESLHPYRLSRFEENDLLTGAYGVGSIS